MPSSITKQSTGHEPMQSLHPVHLSQFTMAIYTRFHLRNSFSDLYRTKLHLYSSRPAPKCHLPPLTTREVRGNMCNKRGRFYFLNQPSGTALTLESPPASGLTLPRRIRARRSPLTYFLSLRPANKPLP